MSSTRPNCDGDCLNHFPSPEDDPTAACDVACMAGHVECLRHAHEHGSLWDVYTCNHASIEGHIDCLRYAHEHGCPWDHKICESASINGHVELLRYAHEHGCPLTENTCLWASEFGGLDCLHYTLENGCPVPDFTRVLVHTDVVPYLYHRGFRLSSMNSGVLKGHIRVHVRRAWTLVKCAILLLGAHHRACERVYSPDGVGYREAETSFRDTVRKVDSSIP